jgi:hypothetical protein
VIRRIFACPLRHLLSGNIVSVKFSTRQVPGVTVNQPKSASISPSFARFGGLFAPKTEDRTESERTGKHLSRRTQFGVPSKSRTKLRLEHGAGTIKAILWTVLLVYGAFVAYKILPAYVAEYQLQDKMQEQAKFAVVNRYPEEQIRDSIFKVIKDLEIPVKREDIKITATQDVVRIACDYSVPVDLLVYQMNLHFTPSSENKNL